MWSLTVALIALTLPVLSLPGLALGVLTGWAFAKSRLVGLSVFIVDFLILALLYYSTDYPGDLSPVGWMWMLGTAVTYSLYRPRRRPRHAGRSWRRRNAPAPGTPAPPAQGLPSGR